MHSDGVETREGDTILILVSWPPPHPLFLDSNLEWSRGENAPTYPFSFCFCKQYICPHPLLANDVSVPTLSRLGTAAVGLSPSAWARQNALELMQAGKRFLRRNARCGDSGEG